MDDLNANVSRRKRAMFEVVPRERALTPLQRTPPQLRLVEPDLPPVPLRIPPELPGLDRLINLLGNVVQAGGKLTPKVQAEVLELSGSPRLPDRQTAIRWKKHLREIRKEVAAEPDPEAEGSAGR